MPNLATAVLMVAIIIFLLLIPSLFQFINSSIHTSYCTFIYIYSILKSLLKHILSLI